jgi:hypothetical protein
MVGIFEAKMLIILIVQILFSCYIFNIVSQFLQKYTIKKLLWLKRELRYPLTNAKGLVHVNSNLNQVTYEEVN